MLEILQRCSRLELFGYTFLGAMPKRCVLRMSANLILSENVSRVSGILECGLLPPCLEIAEKGALKASLHGCIGIAEESVP
jgi:hypothetical protein